VFHRVAAAMLAAALLAPSALPAAAHARHRPTADPSGTIAAIQSATATAPEEIELSLAGGGLAWYALTPQTTYSLVGPGLGAGAPTPTASDLAVGEQVDLTPAATSTDGIADAAQVALVTSVAMGEVTSVATSLGQPTAFTLSANGSAADFVTAPGVLVSPPSGTLSVGQGVVVYALDQGGSADVAYAIDLPGAYPTLSGTLAAVGAASLTLSTVSGPLPFALTGATSVLVGTTPATSAYLVTGAQAAVTFTVGSGGAQATAVSLAESTLSGTVTAVTPSGSATDLTLSTPQSAVTVAVLPTTDLGGASLGEFVPGASVTASGVLVANTLTALSLSLTSPPPAASDTAAGTVTAVTAASLSLATPTATLLFALTPTTAVQVGPYAATAADLAAGEQATVTYTPGAPGVQGTATAVAVVPQALDGSVAAVASPTAFTLARAGGSVAVSVAPDASVQGGPPAVGDAAHLLGVFLSPAAFEAFRVDLAPTVPAPPPVAAPTLLNGRILSAAATDIVLLARGRTWTLALTPTTRYRVGLAGGDPSLLAAGERASVLAAPDPSQVGQLDALVVVLAPTLAVGVVENVETAPGATTLTVRGRLFARPTLPPWVADDHGRGEGHGRPPFPPPGGGRTFTVTLLPATHVIYLLWGTAGAGGASAPAPGQEVAVLGAESDATLMAADVYVLPGLTLPLPGGDHGDRGRHAPLHRHGPPTRDRAPHRGWR
jgi:hypothetical protein